MTALSALLDEPNRRRLAGGRSFGRGVDYAAADSLAHEPLESPEAGR